MAVKNKLFFVLIFSFSLFADRSVGLIGISEVDYLIGNYSANKLKKIEYSGEKRKYYLLPEVVIAYEKMIQEFKKSNPSSVQPRIISGFRSFSDQKKIWNGKFSGKIKMKIEVKNKSPQEKIKLILEYSSAPGTSRHHWGTDFDLNALENKYFEKNGEGEKLYNWLKVNAINFGFCQPYNEERLRNNKGYKEEKWHWSYCRESGQIENLWIQKWNEKAINFKGQFSFSGAEILGELPKVFVQSVNKDCQEFVIKSVE